MRSKGPSEASESESPLARWSRRKRQAAVGEEESDRSGDSAPAGESSEASAAPPEADAPPPPSDADMPPLETLGPESDYSGFMSPGVSDELRRVALRKLFHGPLYNITDGLDDYDDDFTSFAVLHEAFHAKHGKTSAPESAPPEGAGNQGVGDSVRAEPADSPSAEAGQGADADPASRLAGEPAGDEGKVTTAESADRISDSHAEASGGTPGAGEGAVAPGEPDPDDADASAGSLDSSASRIYPAALSSENESVAETASSPSARTCADEEAPIEGVTMVEDTDACGTSGRESDDEVRHG